jgi:hypothetical protein
MGGGEGGGMPNFGGMGGFPMMGGFGGGMGGFPGMGGAPGGQQGGGATVSTVSQIQEKFPEEYKAAQKLRQDDPAAYREKLLELQKKLNDSKEESK